MTVEAQGGAWQELEALCDEATAGLEEERRKTSTLLLALDHTAPLEPDQLQLLTDNHQLLLQLHNSQRQLTVGPLHPQ